MYNNQKRYLIKRIGGWKKLADMIIIEMDLFGNRVLKYSLDALEQGKMSVDCVYNNIFKPHHHFSLLLW
jgi:hypothetical protein